MLDEIRIQINKNRHCMLKDGASILPLCIIPYYADCDLDSDEFAHKAPVLLDCFYETYKFEWDLTTKRVMNVIDSVSRIHEIDDFQSILRFVILKQYVHDSRGFTLSMTIAN